MTKTTKPSTAESRAIRLAEIAGSVEWRRAMRKEVQISRRVLEEHGPVLRKLIEEKTKQLNGLERDARLSARRLKEAEAAAAQLRCQVKRPTTKPVSV